MSVQTSEPGFTLHKLKHDDYHVICGMREEYKTPPPDARVGPAFTRLSVGDRVIAKDGWSGEITGFAVENDLPTPFARVNGRLYHVSTLKRA